MSAVASAYTTHYLDEVKKIAEMLDPVKIDRMIQLLRGVREGGGRLFILGVGGNAGHAVNDFRKICGMEAYAPTDNVSELTARVNDDGWESCFVNWLKGSRLRAGDAVLVFSVGGGNLEKNISGNIVHAVRHAKEIGATVLGIVGRDGGYTAQQADACLVIPTLSPGGPGHRRGMRPERRLQDGAGDERPLGRQERVFSARRRCDRIVRSCGLDHPLERGWGK